MCALNNESPEKVESRGNDTLASVERCPNCGRSLRTFKNSNFCTGCGTRLIRCSNCGALLPADAKFCIKCSVAVSDKVNYARRKPAADTFVCLHCGSVIEAGTSKFCTKCGFPLPQSCCRNPRCGRKTEPGWAFCSYCGHQVCPPDIFSVSRENSNVDFAACEAEGIAPSPSWNLLQWNNVLVLVQKCGRIFAVDYDRSREFLSKPKVIDSCDLGTEVECQPVIVDGIAVLIHDGYRVTFYDIAARALNRKINRRGNRDFKASLSGRPCGPISTSGHSTAAVPVMRNDGSYSVDVFFVNMQNRTLKQTEKPDNPITIKKFDAVYRREPLVSCGEKWLCVGFPGGYCVRYLSTLDEVSGSPTDYMLSEIQPSAYVPGFHFLNVGSQADGGSGVFGVVEDSTGNFLPVGVGHSEAVCTASCGDRVYAAHSWEDSRIHITMIDGRRQLHEADLFLTMPKNIRSLAALPNGCIVLLDDGALYAVNFENGWSGVCQSEDYAKFSLSDVLFADGILFALDRGEKLWFLSGKTR